MCATFFGRAAGRCLTERQLRQKQSFRRLWHIRKKLCICFASYVNLVTNRKSAASVVIRLHHPNLTNCGILFDISVHVFVQRKLSWFSSISCLSLLKVASLACVDMTNWDTRTREKVGILYNTVSGLLTLSAKYTFDFSLL